MRVNENTFSADITVDAVNAPDGVKCLAISCTTSDLEKLNPLEEYNLKALIKLEEMIAAEEQRKQEFKTKKNETNN